MTAELENSPRFRHFDWEKSKTFYYVSKLGSFTNAARFLNMSQPALSRQISSLEQQVGCPLFSRQSRGVTLTRKGEELFSLVETIFFGYKNFIDNKHVRTDNGQQRKIRIATTHTLAAYIFSDLILDYTNEHPNIIFDLIGDDYLIDVFLNDVDIAIHPVDIRIQEGGKEKLKRVQYEFLFSVEKKLYASAEYLERYGEPETVKDLKNHRIVAFSNPEAHPYGDVNWILTIGMPEGKLHKPVFTSNSVESLIDAAKKGIGIVGSYEELQILKNAHLKNILPNVKGKELKNYFIYPDYLKEDKEIIALKNYFKDKLHSGVI